MARIFTEKESVFFVGGRGTKAGEANVGGGCTKDFWDLYEDLSLVMGANGEAMSDPSTWNGSQTACTTSNDGGNLRITKTGGFSNCAAGLIAYIDMVFDINYIPYDEMRYEVLTATDNYIVIDLPHQGSNPTCDVKVGGAFTGIQAALGILQASPEYNVFMFSNKAEIISSAMAPVYAGSPTDDVFVYITGFNTVPGDMDYGQLYFQGPLDALINGVDTDCCVDINANDSAINLIELDTDSQNLVFKHFYLHNNSGTDKNAIDLTGTVINLGFINCKFDDVYDFSNGYAGGAELVECFIKTLRHDEPAAEGFFGSRFDRCVFDGTGRTTAFKSTWERFYGCLFAYGNYGLYTTGTAGLINCVFYKQTVACVLLGGATSSMWGCDNIFAPEETSDYAVLINSSGGSISLNLENSCVYSIGNGPLTAMVSNLRTSRTYDLSGNVIEQDPLFKDPANGDFRLQLASPCMKTGSRTLGSA